jgi:hypothetical protein
MIISGISRMDLESARDVASTLLGNQLVFSQFHSYGTERHQVQLQVADIDGPGARRHSHMSMLGYGKRPRRSQYACAHCYGFFFVAIFERNPDARVRTTKADYRGAYDFLNKYPDVLESNVGSIMYPLRYADECTCSSDEIPTDTIEPWMWERGHAEMPNRENMETIDA